MTDIMFPTIPVPPTLAAVFHKIDLPKLTTHFPHIILAALAWHLLFHLSLIFSARSTHFSQLTPRKKEDWAMHIVSFAHSVLICYLATGVLGSETLKKDRLFGYDEQAGRVYSVACGYFLWDAIICLKNIRTNGIGFAMHGVSCLAVFLLSFKPFLMYYGGWFLLFELSTPFLNIHWFCDKTGRSGSRLQLINGLILLAVFFGARIVLGFYSSYHFYLDMQDQSDRISTVNKVVYFVANVLLNSLNVFWFIKMVKAVRSRFRPRSKRSTNVNGKGSDDEGSAKTTTKFRRRLA
ncbi:TLC domain-containing protein [Phlyctochytrium arcticum]|nr:TLC domain-containing protein [Phlyctochytrium arcticum]